MKNNWLKIGVALVLTLMLGSCGIFNKYKAPEVEVEGLYRDLEVQDSTTIADLTLSEFFDDAILLALIEEGIESNFDLRIAETRVKQARTGLMIARSAYFPTVSVGASAASVGKASVTGASSEFDNWAYTLFGTASWELDLWGKIGSKKRASRAQFYSTESYRDLVQTSIVGSIASMYYSLLALDEQYLILLETVGLMEQTIKTMEALHIAGELHSAAVEQTKAMYYSTQVSIPSLESGIIELENSLSVLLGRHPGKVVRASIDRQKVVGHLNFGVPAQMLSRRPDVKQAEYGFMSAFELTNSAKASMYPSLNLGFGPSAGAGYGTMNTLSSFFSAGNFFANLFGGLTQPLFAGNQLRGQRDIAKAQEEEAFLTFQKTVLQAGAEVTNCVYKYRSSIKKNDYREQQVVSLTKASRDTKKLLDAGISSYLEVLTAEQNLLQARLGQVDDKLEQLNSIVELYRALGGGVDEVEKSGKGR